MKIGELLYAIVDKDGNVDHSFGQDQIRPERFSELVAELAGQRLGKPCRVVRVKLVEVTEEEK